MTATMLSFSASCLFLLSYLRSCYCIFFIHTEVYMAKGMRSWFFVPRSSQSELPAIVLRDIMPGWITSRGTIGWCPSASYKKQELWFRVMAINLTGSFAPHDEPSGLYWQLSTECVTFSWSKPDKNRAYFKNQLLKCKWDKIHLLYLLFLNFTFRKTFLMVSHLGVTRSTPDYLKQYCIGQQFHKSYLNLWVAAGVATGAGEGVQIAPQWLQCLRHPRVCPLTRVGGGPSAGLERPKAPFAGFPKAR